MPKRKNNNLNEEIDVSRFYPLIEEALKAFGKDVTYGVEMSNRASINERKRASSKARTSVRKTEVQSDR